MRARAFTMVCLGIAAIAPWASAQPLAEMTYSIQWENDISPNTTVTKGIVWSELSPEIGTIIRGPLPGKGQTGTLMAFAASVFDLLNVQNGSTGTLTWTVPDEFNIANLPGTPDGNGGILGTNAGQFAAPANPNPNTQQQVKLLELTWTTSDFTPRTVEYATKATSGKVYADIGLAAWVGVNVKVNAQGGSFNVVPAPGVAALGATTCCIGLGMMLRRRR